VFYNDSFCLTDSFHLSKDSLWCIYYVNGILCHRDGFLPNNDIELVKHYWVVIISMDDIHHVWLNKEISILGASEITLHHA